MKYANPLAGLPLRPGRIWLIGCIGLPIMTLVLWITQPDTPIKLAALQHQLVNPLDPPYRYPFVPQGQPMVALNQEIAFYQERTRQFPDRALEQAALATTYLRMARTTGAGNWYLLADQTARRSLALLQVDNAEALVVLARVAEAQHDFATALTLARQIPNPTEALPIQVSANLAQGNLQAANQGADRLVETTLSMSAFTLQALTRHALGKDKAALQSFQYALEAESSGELSQSARTRTLLGRFYYERGQLQRAEDLYQEALRILPNSPPTLINLAQLEMRRGNSRRAERYYDQLDQSTQGVPTVFASTVLRGRAQLSALRGQSDQAMALWAQAETQLRQGLNDRSNFALGHRRDLARLLLERGQPQDFPEAVKLMETEVKVRRDAETLSTYAWALAQTHQWQQAQTVIQEAIALGTQDAGLFHRAAMIERALGNSAEADRFLQQTQAIDPNFDSRARQVMDLGIGLGS